MAELKKGGSTHPRNKSFPSFHLTRVQIDLVALGNEIPPPFLSFPEILGEGKELTGGISLLGMGGATEPFLAHGIILRDIFESVSEPH